MNKNQGPEPLQMQAAVGKKGTLYTMRPLPGLQTGYVHAR